MANYIKSLHLNNFRGYDSLYIDLSKEINIFIGKNGSGKTNLLESLSIFNPGKGLRKADIHKLINQHNPHNGFIVGTSLSTDYGNIYLSTLAKKENEEGFKRKNFIDGNPAKQIDMLEYIKIIWLTPQMNNLFIESSDKRRKFLDRLIFNFTTSHSATLSKLEKAIRERNKLLKMSNIKESWINSIEQAIAQNSIIISAERINYIKQINLILSKTDHDAIRLFNKGLCEDLLINHKALRAEEILLNQLQSNRLSDQETGTTSIGAHKSDFGATYLNKNIDASLCSTGEQKRILISIILSHAKMHLINKKNTPIILLDEFLSYLDKEKREMAIKEIIDMQLQTFITSSEESIFKNYADQITTFQIQNNHIKVA